MLFNFGRVLKLEALEGVFQNRITGNFLFLAKECNLDTKVFMTIKILPKKGWKRKQ